MSAIMKLHDTKKPDKVFVCYDFKQVRDAVLIVMFIEKQKRVGNDGKLIIMVK